MADASGEAQIKGQSKDRPFEGLYKKTVEERQDLIAAQFKFTPEEIALIKKEGPLPFESANRMIENVYSTMPLPLGLATNFVIDGKSYVVPYALEEPSVVAAASYAAKLSGGFKTYTDDPIMIGQIQLINVKDVDEAKEKILANKDKLLDAARDVDSTLVKLGGGPKDIVVEVMKTRRGDMIDVQLLVDVRDAMGANAINTMTEKATPLLEEISGGKALLRIISNLALYRKTYAKGIWTKECLEASVKGEISGDEVVDRILDAYEFAVASPFRCATHNKGIMNGIDAVTIATGNDFRGVEAGVHAFAAHEKKKYSPLTHYYKDDQGNLVGEIELPIVLATIGGTIKSNPMAQVNLKILGVKTSRELARVVAAVGLAQNFAALRALATTGIQAGHMKLHSKILAVQAGAVGLEVDMIALKMVEGKNISHTNAEKLLNEHRNGKEYKGKQ